MNIGFLSKRVRGHAVVVYLLVTAMILSFMPATPALAAGGATFTVDVNPLPVMGPQDLNIHVSSDLTITGTPMVLLTPPGEDTQAIGLNSIDPNNWNGMLFHVDSFTADGTYTVEVSNPGDNTTTTAFSINLGGNGSTIDGTVLDLTGTSTAGCRVQLFTQDPKFNKGPSAGSRFTDSISNYYYFHNLPHGTYWLVAYPPDDATDTASSDVATVTVDGTNTVAAPGLQLRTPSLRGRVVDPNGAPVSGGVRVSARTQDWSQEVEAFTNSQGYFALPPVPQPDNYIVTAFANPGTLVDSAPQVFALDPAGTVTLSEAQALKLQNAVITGSVLNPESQTATNGVDIMIHNNNWSFQEHARTDNSGVYHFGLIPAGDYTLEAQPGPDSSYSQATPVTVHITGGVQTLSAIKLTNPLVSGTVTNPDSTTAQGVFVQVHDNTWTHCVGSPTDSSGKYKIGGLPDGNYIIEAMPGPGSSYSKSISHDITITAGTTQTVDLQLTTPLIVGKVVGPDGITPVSNANVSLHTANWDESYFTQPTGPDGSFSFGGVATGTYILDVQRPWDRPNLISPGLINVFVPPSEDTYTVSGDCTTETVSGVSIVKVEFTKAVKNIIGTVTKNATAVANANVVAFQQQGSGFTWGLTDSNGKYKLGVSGGQWMVSVEPNHDSTSSVDWAYTGQPKPVTFNTDTSSPETQTVDFSVVTANALVTGTLLDPSNHPVTQARVEVRNSTGQGNGANPNPAGNFSINVPAGSYQVMVFLPPDSPYGPPQVQKIAASDSTTTALGDLILTTKSSQITGHVTTGGQGVSNVRVTAWQEQGGFTETTSSADGSYTLNVSAGSWEVNVEPSSDASYVYSGPPTRVTVVDHGQGSANFAVTYADSTIQGRVVDGSGNIISDLYGFAVAMNNSGGYGGPLNAGRFEIKVPSGTYSVSGGLPPGAPYMLNSVNLSVSGGTKSVTLTVQPNDRTISGKLIDETSTTITDTNTDLFVEVFAVNGNGSFQHTVAEYDNVAHEWKYTLNVSDGTWRIGYFVNGGSGYIGRPPMDADSAISVSGTNVTRDITLYKASAVITGQVKMPDGSGVPYAFVGAGEPESVNSNGRNAMFVPGTTDKDGNYTLTVPAGTYEVHAGISPEKMRTGNLTQPAPVQVTVTNDTTTTDVNLQFGSADATITGTVKLGGVGKPALVWTWSDSGGYSEVNATDTGTFSLSVKGNDTWHVGASYESDSGFSVAPEQAVSLNASGTANITLDLASVVQTVQGVSVTFPANQMKVIDLSDGTKIQIPAGALAVNGNVTVVAKPKAGMRKQKDAQPVGLGYELTVMDDSGQVITDFNAGVTITFPYNPNSLPSGVTESDLVPAYWDDQSGSWQKVDSAVVDTVNHTITVTVTHFSLWGNIAKATVTAADIPGGSGPGGGSQEAKGPAAPLGFTATYENSQTTLTWSANTEADMAGYNLYRGLTSDVSKATKIASPTKGTTSYTDTSIATQTTYYYWLSAYNTGGTEGAKTGPVVAGPDMKVSFKDVLSSHWALSYISKLVEKGIIKGYQDGSFRPEATVTRAEFAKMICLAMGWQLENPATSSFSDVPQDSWAYQYIETAKAKGILGGYENGTFAPGKKITRAEIAKILAKALNLAPGTSSMKDVSSNWAKDYIGSCVKAGIVSGYAGGDFRPNNSATRAEAAKMISAVLKD